MIANSIRQSVLEQEHRLTRAQDSVLNQRPRKKNTDLWTIIWLAFLVSVQIHCDEPRRAVVEEIDGDKTRTMALSLESVNGKRDGANVKASLVFIDSQNRDRLEIGLELDLGPPIHLAGGRFLFRQGGKEISGNVEATSLDFEAGQSGGMSLGGQFVLFDSSPKALYRVFVPPTTFDSSYH